LPSVAVSSAQKTLFVKSLPVRCFFGFSAAQPRPIRYGALRRYTLSRGCPKLTGTRQSTFHPQLATATFHVAKPTSIDSPQPHNHADITFINLFVLTTIWWSTALLGWSWRCRLFFLTPSSLSLLSFSYEAFPRPDLCRRCVRTLQRYA
jgi:hypothetical protein